MILLISSDFYIEISRNIESIKTYFSFFLKFLEKHRKRDQDFLAKGEGKAYRGLFIEGN